MKQRLRRAVRRPIPAARQSRITPTETALQSRINQTKSQRKIRRLQKKLDTSSRRFTVPQTLSRTGKNMMKVGVAGGVTGLALGTAWPYVPNADVISSYSELGILLFRGPYEIFKFNAQMVPLLPYLAEDGKSVWRGMKEAGRSLIESAKNLFAPRLANESGSVCLSAGAEELTAIEIPDDASEETPAGTAGAPLSWQECAQQAQNFLHFLHASAVISGDFDKSFQGAWLPTVFVASATLAAGVDVTQFKEIIATHDYLRYFLTIYYASKAFSLGAAGYALVKPFFLGAPPQLSRQMEWNDYETETEPSRT